MAPGRDLSTRQRAATSIGTDATGVRRDRIVAAVFVAWTLFVWVGRIRNALADPGSAGAAVLLSLSFVVPALALGMVLAAGWRRAGSWSAPVSIGLVALGAWTVVVWVVRAADIALGGDWSIGFVVVHLVLAAVSIGLAVPTLLAAGAAVRTTASGTHERR